MFSRLKKWGSSKKEEEVTEEEQKAQEEKEEKAAVKIQSTYRGMSLRKKTMSLRKKTMSGEPVQPHLPVLIVPGFMSSRLVIKKSEPHPAWEGGALWLNLQSIGYEGMLLQKHNVEVTEEENKEEKGESENDINFKNLFIEHLALSSDMATEKEGISVRAMEGIPAVEYLAPGLFTSAASYVFAPVLAALRKGGYTDNKDVKAAPYDWRMAPCLLEERDQYFTRTLDKIEELYNTNDNRPVLVLGHSMGCKVSHYLFNFAAAKKGEDWLRKHVHTYMPVGAPHLGAPAALRSMVLGDYMGLGAFLKPQEAMVMGRSFASSLWLVPRKLPSGAPPCAQFCKTSLLKVNVKGLTDVDKLKLTQSVCIKLTFNKQKLWGKFYGKSTDPNDPDDPNDDTCFIFAAKQHELSDADNFHLSLTISGLDTNAKHELTAEEELEKQNAAATKIQAQYRGRLARKKYPSLSKGFKSLKKKVANVADKAAAAVSYQTSVAATEKIKLSTIEGLTEGMVEVTLPVALKPGHGESDGDASVQLEMEWIHHSHESYLESETGNADTRIDDDICIGVVGEDSTPIGVKHYKKADMEYRHIQGCSIVEKEELPRIFEVDKKYFAEDPFLIHGEPRPPGVSRVRAVYGVDMQTEISAVYRANSTFIEEAGGMNINPFHRLDTSARLTESNGYKIAGGCIYETGETSQQVIGGGEVKHGGDGTVPYYSLQHVRTWNGEGCEVVVDELTGAEHRGILANTQFHEILLNYVREQAK